MKRLCLAGVVALCVAGAACRAQDALPHAQEIRAWYEKGLEANGIVGSSLALVRDGRVALREDYGAQSLEPRKAVDDETAYHWASCTKTLTGIAIMQLR